MLFIAVQPTGMNPDNKIADITLDYHVPGSAQVVTQTVTLHYPDGGYDDPQPGRDDVAYACSAGGTPGWLALVALALVAVRRRKR